MRSLHSVGLLAGAAFNFFDVQIYLARFSAGCP